jgi:3-phenylpropionate/trans-cinnamate dioxygenase ferredoxin component
MSTTDVHSLVKSEDLPDEYVLPVYLEDLKRRVSVVRIAGELYAFDDLCPCGGTPCSLSSGRLQGTSLMCQCHGSTFDLAAGTVQRGPATAPPRRYDVSASGGEIHVAIAG